MTWNVYFHSAFESEFDNFDKAVQDTILAKALFLGEFAPQLGRPHVDTLSGSRHANMKELRLEAADGV